MAVMQTLDKDTPVLPQGKGMGYAYPSGVRLQCAKFVTQGVRRLPRGSSTSAGSHQRKCRMPRAATRPGAMQHTTRVEAREDISATEHALRPHLQKSPLEPVDEHLVQKATACLSSAW
jgi:hypothetical protein